MPVKLDVIKDNKRDPNVHPVLVIGAGIAGIQSSLDLAEAGVGVVLVDRKPSIGGIMAALDKNFPTLDCSICIQAPVMSEAMNHPNVKVYTSTEIQSVEGEVGDFTVTMIEKARYVTDACTRCDLCVPACPVTLPNEFDHGIGYRSAIYTPFAQAEPGPYAIDIDNCLNTPPNVLACNRCTEACLPGAIDFNQPKITEHKVKISAIITATGFEMLDPGLIEEYGYGKHLDILTSMEYERMLNAAGPTAGEIIKPSNHHHPDSVLFVLCVGSRDQRYCNYCSRVCCMYSIKEAYQTKDHGVDNVDVLYMDIRAYGKGFDEFHDRTLKEGIQYIRGRPAKIDTHGPNPVVTYEDTEKGELVTKEYGMIVLAPALLPSQGTGKLAELLGVNLDMDGFIENGEFEGFPVATSKEGVYVCGCASGPKDIPDSVAEAGAAAAAAMTHVEQRFWPLEVFEETINTEDEGKIGVFVCDCGSNIAGTVDVPNVVEYVKGMEGVIHSEEVMFACAGSTQSHITDIVKEKGINRLVVAACSPKTHQDTFKRACAKAGLNRYLVEMSNIRNHNSWVHKKEPEMATEKAKDMIRMSIEKTKHMVPLQSSDLPVIQKAVVVGGGATGMAAAWNLAKQGYETHLIERDDALGGMLNKLDRIAPTGASAETIKNKMIADLTKEGVQVHLSTKVEAISGYVGNYAVSLSSGDTYDVGAIVLAYGGTVYQPKPIENPGMKVISTVELDKTLESREENNVTFVACVGSRVDDVGCSRYCCTTMIYQALSLREQGKHVTVLYKDIRTYSRHAEEMYYEAARKGVVFMQYPTELDPEEHVRAEEGFVIAYDELIGQNVAIPTDLMVQVVGITPPDDHSVADMLKVSKTTDNFLLELHPKLAPVEAAVQGVYMGGVVRGPVTLEEAISQGLAAAGKASDLLAKDTVTKEPLTAFIDPEKCTGCTRCASVCPFGAITGEKKELHHVIEAACTGCGTCSAECRYGAINMPGFTDSQINVQIDEALRNNPEDKVLVFACNWCSYAGADQAGIAKIQYPPSSRIIRTMCSGRISGDFVERAFEKGAGGVLMTGCRLTDKGSDCHYNFANVHTQKRFDRWHKKITRKGVDPDRLQLQWVSAAEGKVLAAKLYEMEEILKRTNTNKSGMAATMPAAGGGE
jgi:heterodisulfide reductase subunit A